MKKNFLFVLLFTAPVLMYAQNVGINAPVPTNRLHVISTSDPLRLEGVVSGAATDSVVTINATGVLRRRTAAAFVSGAGWSLTGNPGLSATTNFLGTTSLVPLLFRTNNLRAGKIDPDSTFRNNSFGHLALNTAVTGMGNNAFGYQALSKVTTGFNNTAIGDSAGVNITFGADNTLVGADAGYALLGGSFGVVGSQNVAVGSRALPAAVTGNDNIAVGYKTLENSVSSSNIAIGSNALNKNNVGSDNLAIGTNALNQNTGANNINIAIGNNALVAAATSTEQLAIGYNAGSVLTNGGYNTLLGHYTLSSITTSTNNTMVGYWAGVNQTSGSNNTYMGYLAGNLQNAGSSNTYIGYQAGGTAAASYTNSSALGNGAPVASNNLVRLGNSSTTVIGGAVGFSTLSDERVKTNVRTDVKGLEFISQLRPVTYNYDLKKMDDMQKVPQLARTSYVEKQNIRYSGFLAQEVEAAAQKTGYDFSAVNKPKNDQTLYSINYSEMVVPLVKAVQELKELIDKQQAEIAELKKALTVKK